MVVLTVLWLAFPPARPPPHNPHPIPFPFAGGIVVSLQELENMKKGDVVIEPTR